MFSGKSLSIICSALKWLKDHQKKVEDELTEVKGDDSEPAWVNEQFHELQVCLPRVWAWKYQMYGNMMC